MLKTLTDKFDAARKSPKVLDYSIRTFKGLTLLCAGGIGLWGGLTLGGLGLIGLKAMGLGIPAIVGDAALGTGVLMCIKSVVFNRVFSYAHRELEKIKAHRNGTKPPDSQALAPQPAAATEPSRFAQMKAGFNHAARRIRARAASFVPARKASGDTPKAP